eukprot:2233084-Rhodomonas_salina.2
MSGTGTAVKYCAAVSLPSGTDVANSAMRAPSTDMAYGTTRGYDTLNNIVLVEREGGVWACNDPPPTACRSAHSLREDRY